MVYSRLMDTTYGAFLLLIACVLGGGVSGALLRTWDIHRRLYSLEVQLGETQGIVQREVKIRAGQTKTAVPRVDKEAMELLKGAQNLQPAPQAGVQWWPSKV